jgi:uncharacterized protein GlcG (DUF336 family)
MRPGSMRNAVLVSLALSLPGLVSCSGGSGSAANGPAVAAESPECDGSCASSSTFLSVEDVQSVIARAVAEAQTRNAAATIAVVDRVGNVLGVFQMNGASMAVTITSGSVDGGLEGVNIIPSTLAAIAKAVTAAYLSSEGNAFSTRTASQIVQSHFNPGEVLATSGPLSGVQFSQLPCSDLNLRFNAGAPDAGPKRSPLGLSADPGGFPLYKGGTPVGAVGIVADGIYGLDTNVQDQDADLDEAIALAATFSLAAPDDRRADRLTVEGKLLRFSDMAFTDMTAPTALPPAFATLNGGAGTLQAVPGYTDATIQAGTAFGQAASGIRPDALDYADLDAFVLVDAANVERFRPRAGTESGIALSADESREILSGALRIANRTRGQIRRPLGAPARVTITLVDSNGTILGIVRGRDAPIFGIDVSVQKARAAAFFSNPNAAAALTALPPAVYLNQGLTVLRAVPLGDYVTALRNFMGTPNALADGQVAFSNRALGNLARPFYPDGADGAPAGPLAKPQGQWSPFSTGVQLDLVYNAIVNHVAFVAGAAPDVGTNCTGGTGFDSGFSSVAPIAGLANGIQIFPGSVPVYRDRQLVGAVGVSGDGVDQDDMIAFLGVQEAVNRIGGLSQAPSDLRADQLTPAGSRLRYVACPQAPFTDSTDSEPCGGL